MAEFTTKIPCCDLPVNSAIFVFLNCPCRNKESRRELLARTARVFLFPFRTLLARPIKSEVGHPQRTFGWSEKAESDPESTEGMETADLCIGHDQEQSIQQDDPRPKTQNCSGAAAFRLAVVDALLQNAEAIATALVQNAIDGHILSAKFLYELVTIQEKESESEAARKLPFNLIDEWEADKKWLAELRINAAKDAATWREPD